MIVTSGCVTITKDEGNLIGICIGGGAPMCPCLYIVQVTKEEEEMENFIDCVHQVFDNTPAAKDATLEAGDELVGINGTNVKVALILIPETICFNFLNYRVKPRWK